MKRTISAQQFVGTLVGALRLSQDAGIIDEVRAPTPTSREVRLANGQIFHIAVTLKSNGPVDDIMDYLVDEHMGFFDV